MSERHLQFIAEACDWIALKAPSLTDMREMWEVAQLYINLQIVEKDNQRLLGNNQELRADRKRMSDLFDKQAELVAQQETLISDLQKSRNAKQETIDALHGALVYTSEN